jgi:hypothetical protein
MIRAHPQWHAVVDLVRGGRIGDLRLVTCHFSYFLEDPSNIRSRIDWGGGGLMDIGCYAVHVARWLFDAEPLRVTCLMERDPESGTDALTSGVLDFGVRHATFTCGTRSVPGQRVQVMGTAGRIEVEVPFNAPPDRSCIAPLDDGSDLFGGSSETLAIPPADQFALQADAFARAVRGTAAPLVAVEDAVAQHGGAGCAAAVGGGRNVGRRQSLGRVSDEGRPFPRPAGDGQVTGHPPCELPADGETEAHPFTRLGEGAAELDERLEDGLLLVLRDAGTGIPHADADSVTAGRALEDHGFSGRRELHRVRQQVQQDLLGARAVAPGERRRARTPCRSRRTPSAWSSGWIMPSTSSRRAWSSTGRMSNSIRPASRRARLRRSLTRPRRCCWLVRTRSRYSRCWSLHGPGHLESEQVRVAADGVEGGPQLVGQRGEELALGAVGGLHLRDPARVLQGALFCLPPFRQVTRNLGEAHQLPGVVAEGGDDRRSPRSSSRPSAPATPRPRTGPRRRGGRQHPLREFASRAAGG